MQYEKCRATLSSNTQQPVDDVVASGKLVGSDGTKIHSVECRSVVDFHIEPPLTAFKAAFYTMAASSSAMPTVMLSFDNSSGGAWDDRTLIKMYDSAMQDFHVSGLFLSVK